MSYFDGLDVICWWLAFSCGLALGAHRQEARALFRRPWIRLTWWRTVCEDCNGTGICALPNPDGPHSCCGGCDRRWVPETWAPGFKGNRRPGLILIGDGIAWRRPWSRRQHPNRPRLVAGDAYRGLL